MRSHITLDMADFDTKYSMVALLGGHRDPNDATKLQPGLISSADDVLILNPDLAPSGLLDALRGAAVDRSIQVVRGGSRGAFPIGTIRYASSVGRRSLLAPHATARLANRTARRIGRLI